MKKDDIYGAFTNYKNKRKELENKYNKLRRELENDYEKEIKILEANFDSCIKEHINNKKALLNYLNKIKKEKEHELGEKRKEIHEIEEIKKKFKIDGIYTKETKKKSPSSMDLENSGNDIVEKKYSNNFENGGLCSEKKEDKNNEKKEGK